MNYYDKFPRTTAAQRKALERVNARYTWISKTCAQLKNNERGSTYVRQDR